MSLGASVVIDFPIDKAYMLVSVPLKFIDTNHIVYTIEIVPKARQQGDKLHTLPQPFVA